MRSALFLTSLALAAACPAAARAATLDVTVRDADGRPVPDAVVTFQTPQAGRQPVRFPWPMEMRQQNIAFQPHVLIVPVGAAVAFPNLDTVRHHVYSFSKPKRFQLKLYGREEARSVVFDKPGVVAVGCNIHDQMSGIIVAVDTPYAARTDAAGRAVLPAVPAGAGTLAVWSPLVRGPDNRVAQPLTLPAAGLKRTIGLVR